MTQLNNAPVEPEIDLGDWEQYKDDKVAAKPRIHVSETICESCSG